MQESKVIAPGDKMALCESPFGNIGMSVCYDVRLLFLFCCLLFICCLLFFVCRFSFVVCCSAAKHMQIP
jgi:predicted amidohydrolase